MPKSRSKRSRKIADPAQDFLAYILREHPALQRVADQVAPVNRFQLRRLRQGLGLEQAEVARTCGMSQQSLSQAEWRENAEAITIGKMRKIARAMGFDLVYCLLPASKAKRRP